MSFDNLGLNDNLLNTIREKGYTEPTPIQEKAIPVILKGRDVLGRAQTGTGKTAAFAVPMIQLLGKSKRTQCSPRALILIPTRELANQVEQSIIEYGESTDLVSTTIYGGVSYNPQVKRLNEGVDIIVACPGRLLDLAKQRQAVLDNVEILVLDEADRMLDMGFSFEISRILQMIPEKRLTLLFSATFSDEIKKLADKVLTDPELIEISPQNEAAENVNQVVYPVRKEQKRVLLSKLIRKEKWTRTLVFTKTKFGAENLKDFLVKDGIKVKAIHGNKSQAARSYSLEDFKNGIVNVLVATDVAARGLDIDDLPYVVNFDIPIVAEDYIHRIGRTGRAGKTGFAVSLVSREELPLLWKIEKLLKTEITVVEIDGFRQETKAEFESAQVFQKIREKKKDEKFKKKPRSPRKNNYGQNSDETVKLNKSKKKSKSSAKPGGIPGNNFSKAKSSRNRSKQKPQKA
jgi:ATP-dependent RNA helicase RhlE